MRKILNLLTTAGVGIALCLAACAQTATYAGAVKELSPDSETSRQVMFATPQGTSISNILNANGFTGSDAGAKINAAYAAVPNYGGVILYQPNLVLAGGGETFSTPIVFGKAQ